MMLLTDAFTWEDLPTRDPESGSLTMAAWISRVQRAMLLVMQAAAVTHTTQSTLRILLSEDRSLLYSAWYPFDTNKTPAYEFINIVQVKPPITKHHSFSLRCIP
jgi:hypothetical protein